jgi:hypothetical protein
LALLLLIAEQDPARYGRAAARWHSRFVLANIEAVLRRFRPPPAATRGVAG